MLLNKKIIGRIKEAFKVLGYYTVAAYATQFVFCVLDNDLYRWYEWLDWPLHVAVMSAAVVVAIMFFIYEKHNNKKQ